MLYQLRFLKQESRERKEAYTSTPSYIQSTSQGESRSPGREGIDENENERVRELLCLWCAKFRESPFWATAPTRSSSRLPDTSASNGFC
mmetsp:Transcript_26603/g.62502  ORF Transcript_26603/g.62502 Transcript_26603/m.62502 type:complete len:89 (+) Transcript_26603:60-326(+)